MVQNTAISKGQRHYMVQLTIKYFQGTMGSWAKATETSPGNSRPDEKHIKPLDGTRWKNSNSRLGFQNLSWPLPYCAPWRRTRMWDHVTDVIRQTMIDSQNLTTKNNCSEIWIELSESIVILNLLGSASTLTSDVVQPLLVQTNWYWFRNQETMFQLPEWAVTIHLNAVS